MAYANVIHTKRLVYYWTSSFYGLGQRKSYNWRDTAKKLFPCMQDAHVHQLLWLLLRACIPGGAHIVRPHPDYWTHVEDHLSATEDAVVHLDTCTFGSPQRDSACVWRWIWRWIVVTSDHIDKSSVWKLLAASCVRVCSWSLNPLPTCLSPARNVFVSSANNVCLRTSTKRIRH